MAKTLEKLKMKMYAYFHCWLITKLILNGKRYEQNSTSASGHITITSTEISIF